MNFEFLLKIDDEVFLEECSDLYDFCYNSEKTVHSQPTVSLSSCRDACGRIMKFYYLKNDGQNRKVAENISTIQKSKIVSDSFQNAIQRELQKKEDEINEREKNNSQRIPKTEEDIKNESLKQYGVLDERITMIREMGNDAVHKGNLDNVELHARKNLESLFIVISSILKYCDLINEADIPKYKEPPKEETSHEIIEDDIPDEYNYENASVLMMEDGKTRISFSDSDKYYIGEVKNNLPNGEGSFFYSTESVYEGEWKKGLPNGYGKRVYDNGKIYDGEWENGKRHGKGIYYTVNDNTGTKETVIANWVDNRLYDEKGEILFGDGSRYVGGIKSGYLSGKGCFYWNNGSLSTEGLYIQGKLFGYVKRYYPDGQLKYEGEYKDGKKEGKGRTYYENGQLRYEGDFKGGKGNGKGKLYYDDGQLRYEGEYLDDKWNGIGKYFIMNGILSYEGNFKDGKREGKGKQYYENGQVMYEGEYKDGKWEGQGKKYYENGQPMYEGEYKESKANGKGKYYYENGQLDYEGDWKDNRREGLGKKYYENGQLMYEGEYKDGKWEGLGKYYYENGQLKYEGEYKENKPIGMGKYYYENGRLCYEGEHKDGKWEGQGKKYYENGQLMYEGEYKENKANGKGKYYYENGQLDYNGDWKDNRREGLGKKYYTSGQLMYEGEYKDGKWEGQGKNYYENGQLCYEGGFKDNKREGHGKNYSKDGKLDYEGTWREGYLHGHLKYRTNDNKYTDGYWINGKKLSDNDILSLELDEPFIILFKVENALKNIKEKKYSFTTKDRAVYSCELINKVLVSNEAKDLMIRKGRRICEELNNCKKEYSSEAIRSGDTSLYMIIKQISEVIEQVETYIAS